MDIVERLREHDMWYLKQFDYQWVRCMNPNCRAEYRYADIVKKRKCPKCRMDNKHCLPELKRA